MRNWVAFLCFSQIAYSKTIVTEASVRETGEPFPYPSTWEPLRIKQTTEKLVVDQLHNEAYPKVPKPPNKEINDQDKIHQHPMINYGYELNPDHISFTWETTMVSPDKYRNHETAKIKEEKNELETSQQKLEKKYSPPIASKDEVPLDSSTSEPRSSTASVMDFTLKDSRNESYTPPPQPISLPQKKVQVPLQTQTILIPPEEPILFLPKLETTYRPSEIYKQYNPLFVSLITPLPSSMLPSLVQELPILFQPGNSVSYPSRSNTGPSTLVPLPPIQPLDFKLFDPILEIASYPPPSSIISPKKDQSSSAQILMLLPSTELVSNPHDTPQYNIQPPLKPASFLLNPLSEYVLFKDNPPKLSIRAKTFPPPIHHLMPGSSQETRPSPENH